MFPSQVAIASADAEPELDVALESSWFQNRVLELIHGLVPALISSMQITRVVPEVLPQG